MKFVVTIDTEEDNWARYSATDNPVLNIEEIVRLQELFDYFDVRPTYLVTHPVSTNRRSVAILRKILDQGRCEIGMHCHPWNTPPFDGKKDISESDTMLSNLDEDTVHAKLSVLHDAIQKSFSIQPVSFRAGRWGFGPSVALSLCRLGYRTDTSVTPFIDWRAYNGPDYSGFGPEIFRFDSKGYDQRNENGDLLEVPATVGFLQPNFRWCQKAYYFLMRPLISKLHIAGILERFRLLNKVWLSPENTSWWDMKMLCRRMLKNNATHINMTFHSTSLKPGLSPFCQSKLDSQQLFLKIKKFVEFARDSGWESQTLSQVADWGCSIRTGSVPSGTN